MSYLEMEAAPMPDMSSGIISVWFRDLSKGKAPDGDKWPSGPWEAGGTSMLPPDTTELVKTLDPPSIFYWSAYGIPVGSVLGGGLFLGGSPFYGPAPVIMPLPPPLAVSQMRMILTFGDDDQSYDYCPWELQRPDVIEAVLFISGLNVIYRVTDWPPPYKPYWKVLGGKPVGIDGKLKVANMKLGAAQNKPKMVPQSFIGIAQDGYLTICLQTKTRADYKGYAYQLDNLTPITATQTIFHTPGLSVEKIPGYWDGFLFYYKDISNEVMAAGPEFFVIGGERAGNEFPLPPRIDDATWHHLLFSFDISGGVTSVLPETPLPPGGGDLVPPDTKTACKAWLAFDDKNYTDSSLQHAPVVPNGIISPQLDGMGMNGLFPFGPDATYSRKQLGLEPNEIVPQNVWIRGFWGNPRDGLPRFNSAAGLAPGNRYITEGDFNWLVYTGVEWAVIAGQPADGKGSIDPPRPTNPDPAKDLDVPKYSCPGFVIPVKEKRIGIPTGNILTKHNTGVEMAELQIWANKTLDTNDVEMRRLFIDYPKDAKGKPDKTKPLQPVSPSVAAKILGKPDILLHGTSNWKKGKNTGTSGYKIVSGEQVINPKGQFIPVAKIEKFLPDPKIGK
jgi:hypothetical protein